MTEVANTRQPGRVPRKKNIYWIAMVTLLTTQMLLTRNQLKSGHFRTIAACFYGTQLTSVATTNTAVGRTDEAVNLASGIRAIRSAQVSLQVETAEKVEESDSNEVERALSKDATPRTRYLYTEAPKSSAYVTQKTTNDPLSPAVKQQATNNPTPLPKNEVTAAPSQSTPPNSDETFTGSKVTRLSMGMDLFENVCIVNSGRAILRSYSKDGGDMKSTLNFHTGVDNHHVAYGQPLEAWYNDTAKWPLIKTNVLFTQTLYENPGHCISDYMMPLIRDRYERQTLPVDKLPNGMPEYPNWVRLEPRKVQHYDSRSYCNQLLQSSGFVDEKGFIYNREMCFERLYMPATEQQRFPFNQELLPIAAYEMEVGGKLLLPGGANLDPYPSQALHEFRSVLWQNMGLKSDPWTDGEANVVDKVGPRVLFYNRFGSKQRHWGTSLEVAKILRQEYHVAIDVMGEAWNSLNFTQQAQLYNSYSHIATVHGAHMANLIFSRPGTKVVEIVPILYKELRPDESLTRREDAKDQRDWYGPLGWFSAFTRQVDIEHFSLPADDHVKSIPDSNKGMDINATRAANFVANRFALKRRDQAKSQQ